MPITCVGCGYENRLAAAACGSCGARLEARAGCSSCGFANPAGQRFCNECGLPLAGAPRSDAPAVAPSPSVTAAPAATSGPPRSGALPRGEGGQGGPGIVIYAAVALLLAVAVYARAAELGSYPDGLAGAEADVSTAVSRILEGRPVGPWSEAAGGQPTGFVYVLAPWAGVFGESAASLRLASALVGLAAVGMFFVYCRAAFGSRAALLGAMLMAVGLWHIGYSRLAAPAGALLLLQLAASYALLTAMRSDGGLRGFALAGAVFGAAAYTHNAFYVFAVVVGLWWARELLAGERPVSVGVSRCAAFVAVALVVAAPYAWSVAANSDEAGETLRAAGLSRMAEYEEQPGLMERWRFAMRRIASTAASPFMGGDEDAPRLLDPATALLAAAGLAAALWRWRGRETFHLWSTLAAVAVVVGLTTDDAMYGRLIVAAPAVYAAAGYAFDGLLESMRGRVAPAVALAAAWLILVAACAYNVRAYYDAPAAYEDSRWARASFATDGLSAGESPAPGFPRTETFA